MPIIIIALSNILYLFSVLMIFEYQLFNSGNITDVKIVSDKVTIILLFSFTKLIISLSSKLIPPLITAFNSYIMKKAKLKSELCFNLSHIYHFQNSLYASFIHLYQQFLIKQLNHIRNFNCLRCN